MNDGLRKRPTNNYFLVFNDFNKTKKYLNNSPVGLWAINLNLLLFFIVFISLIHIYYKFNVYIWKIFYLDRFFLLINTKTFS